MNAMGEALGLSSDPPIPTEVENHRSRRLHDGDQLVREQSIGSATDESNWTEDADDSVPSITPEKKPAIQERHKAKVSSV